MEHRPQTTLPRSFATRLLAATLASLIAFTPLAPPVARAYDGEGDSMGTTPAEVSGELPQLDDSPELAQEVGEAIEGTGLAEDLLEHPDVAELGETVDPVESPGGEDVTPVSLPGVEARTAVTPQAISLPDAEGSIEGMGESFAPILSSGTATFSVPIAVAPGRRSVQPSLALSYSSTSGNGPVGFGWNLGAPFISRQTDRGLPRYVDRETWHAEEDRFLYNGGQEIVPVDDAEIGVIDQDAVEGETADATARPAELVGWQQYRSRVEGAFMRFFRSPDSRRWVVQSRDGTRYDFGLLPTDVVAPEVVTASAASVERDPESTAASPRIFRWMLTRMTDAHGSAVYYTYRSDGNQSYLSAIHYVSPSSCAGESADDARDCTASLATYGARVGLVYEPRGDVFSSYSSGWRMDTGLRLRRVEITAWHDELEARALVRRYHLGYDARSFHSLLSSVQVEGRPEIWDADLEVWVGVADHPESSLGATVVGRTLPAMQFSYSTMPTTGEQVPGFGGVDVTVHAVEDSPPHGVDEASADLFDVNSDGLPDLIVTDPARYRTSSGAPAVGVFFNGFDGANADPAGTAAHFSGAVPMPMDLSRSSVLSLSNLNIVPMDIDGDGRSDMLHMPRNRHYGWFAPTRAADGELAAVSPADQGWRWTYAEVELPEEDFDPRIDLGRDSSHLEIVDVNNDHLIDVVRTTGTVMQTWLNLGYLPDGDGRFGSARWNGTRWDLSTAPIESCLLVGGTAIDFEDPEVRLAEINGDGLLDIVEVRRGLVRYWPGRGPGSWGEGARACARGEGAGRAISMTDPPPDLPVDLDGVSFMDVNEDGASDLVHVRFDAVDVWFNRAGRSWSPRLTARGTPATPAFMPRTRFADIDGSGTTDIVWANSRDWRYVDLTGGQRPRMLLRVENGLGAETNIAYGSSAEDYVQDLVDAEDCSSSTCDRFTWGRADGAASRVLGPATYRSEGSPVISTVVRSVRTSDRMDVLGREAQESETQFAYHDGYYEGIEQEFRGFGAADAVSLGDWNNPTSYTRTFFQQGRRPQSIADDRLADNPFEALKGREYLTETFDESGVYLSSAHATLTTRPIVEGLDGRWVRYAYVSESNELRYDTTVWAAGTDTLVLSDVVHQRFAAGAWSADPTMPATTRTARVRGANFARIRTTFDVIDSLGQVLDQSAHGHVTLAGAAGDEPIRSITDPILLDGASWLWRTASTYVRGTASTHLRESINEYTAAGDLAVTTLPVSASRSYAFDDEDSGEGGALDPDAGISEDDMVTSSRFDAWGNSVAACVGTDISESAEALNELPDDCLRYGLVEYDALFDQLAEVEAAFVSVTPSVVLLTEGLWDRGLAAVQSTEDPNDLVTTVTYDGFGRLTSVVAPNVENCEGTHPTVRMAYEITTDARARPMSRIISTTETDCDGALGEAGGSLVSITFVDGIGRARAVLATGDESGEWIRRGHSTFDKKGTVRRTYQPDVFAGDPTSLRAVIALPAGPDPGTGCPEFDDGDIPYVISRHDAFGRIVGRHAEDCSYTTTAYHALSTDVCDPLDNDGGHDFYQTCTTSRTDGHGRVIDQILRTGSGAMDERHRLWSYYRADGVVLDLVRAPTTDENIRPSLASLSMASFPLVHRVFHYDTQGRRIGTDDPDTDDPDLVGVDDSRATWRYLFNRAGDLAAVRDPRGCGQNFYYDLGGRLIGEAYVSCDEAYSSAATLPVETVPVDSIGMARTGGAIDVDVRYFYDDDPSWITTEDHGGGMLGRATGTSDRGQRSAVSYDPRGNAVWIAREMAVISDAPALTGSSGDRPSWTEDSQSPADVEYDEEHLYVRRARFDHAGRGVALLLPEDFTWSSTGGMGSAPPIGGVLTYGNRGLPTSASATIDCDPVDAEDCSGGNLHQIVASVEYERDGLPAHTVWGDALMGHVPTASFTEYDVRRRPVRLRTTHDPIGVTGLSAVSEIVDQQLHWDEASNLIEIEDQRPGAEWPAGHRPQSVFIEHDALYRVVGANFLYTQDTEPETRTDSDSAMDWRDTQAALVTAHVDPMEVEPAGIIPALPMGAERVQNLDWSWDWLGNSTQWTDDAGLFYERSIGDVQNGIDIDDPLRPTALYFSTDIPTGMGVSTLPMGASPGWVEVDYGSGGNVVAMTVHGRCANDTAEMQTCADLGTSEAPAERADHLREVCQCVSEQHYQYRWDELDRLAEARRWDRNAATSFSWHLEVRQRYLYDGANVRSVKQTTEPPSESDDVEAGEHAERIALFVFPGDHEVRGLERSGTDEYGARTGANDHVEAQFIIAGARVVWRHETDGEAAHRRIVVPLTDSIGSTSATLDVLTGEVLEAITYSVTGARESLLADVVDPAASEPAGFTGKEADDEVGLTYFGQRYLVPRIGRWASADPLEVHAAAAGEPLNAYHYVSGTLLQARDPVGLARGDTASYAETAAIGQAVQQDHAVVGREYAPGSDITETDAGQLRMVAPVGAGAAIHVRTNVDFEVRSRRDGARIGGLDDAIAVSIVGVGDARHLAFVQYNLSEQMRVVGSSGEHSYPSDRQSRGSRLDSTDADERTTDGYEFRTDPTRRTLYDTPQTRSYSVTEGAREIDRTAEFVTEVYVTDPWRPGRPGLDIRYPAPPQRPSDLAAEGPVAQVTWSVHEHITVDARGERTSTFTYKVHNIQVDRPLVDFGTPEALP